MSNSSAPSPSPDAVSSEAFHVTSSQIVTAVAFNGILGAFFLLLFIAVRGRLRGCGGVYIRRLELPHLLWRPYTMVLGGASRIWSWVAPILVTTDMQLLRSAGLDALMLQRGVIMGIQVFGPQALLGCAMLLPVLLAGTNATPGGAASQGGAVTSSTQKWCMANLDKGASILWLFWATQICYIAWTCWVLRWHARSYQELRLAHLECLDMHQLPEDSLADRPTPSLADPAARRVLLRWLSSWISPRHMHMQDLEALADLRSRGSPVTPEQMAVGAAAAAATGVCTLPGGLALSEEELAALLPPATAAQAPTVAAKALSFDDAAEDAIGAATNKAGATPAVGVEEEGGSGALACTQQLVKATGHLSVLHFWNAEGDRKGLAASFPNLGTPPLVLTPTAGRWRSVVAARGADGCLRYVNLDQYVVLITNIVHSAPSKKHQHMHSPLDALVSGATLRRALPSPGGSRHSASPSPAASRQGSPSPTPAPRRAPMAQQADARDEEDGGGGYAAAGASVIEYLQPPLVGAGEPSAEDVHAKVQGMLARLYPDSLLEVVPVVDSRALEALLAKWDHSVAELGKAEFAARAAAGAQGKGKGAARAQEEVAALRGRLAELQAQVLEERRAALLNFPGSSFFAVFSSQRAAREASGVLLQSGIDTGMYLSALPAPAPDNVNHVALATRWVHSALRSVAVFLPAVFMVLFPIGLLSGLITNLSEILCGLNTDNDFVVWWCTDDARWSTIVKGLITGVLPPAISAAWDTYVLPLWFYACVQYGRAAHSLGAIDIAVYGWFVQNNYWNVFLQPILCTLGLTQIGPLLEGGGWWSLLGTSLPSSYTFFLQLLIARALFTNLMRLFWPHDGSILFVGFRALGMSLPRTPRDEAIIHTPPSTRSARHISAFHLSFLIGLSFAVIAPLVALAAWGYFVTATLTWRYVLLYVYERNKETGGSLFPRLFHGCVANMYISVLFVASVLLTKSSWYAGGTLLVLTPPGIYLFADWCQRTHMQPAEGQPLTRCAAAPRLPAIDAQAYLPAAVRNGAAGWWEEEGKVWSKYGIPKFV